MNLSSMNKGNLEMRSDGEPGARSEGPFKVGPSQETVTVNGLDVWRTD